MESTTELINRLVAATLTTGWENGEAATTITGEPSEGYAAVIGAMLARTVGERRYAYAGRGAPTHIGVLADVAAYRRLLPPGTHEEHPAKMLCLNLGGRALGALAAEAERPRRALTQAV